MIAGLKPYPVYKHSGVPWLAEVPGHWDIGRSKRLFAASTALARPEDVQLSATQAYGVIPQAEFEERVGRRVVKIVKHLDRRRHVDKDDFVMSMRSFQGGLERAWASGAIRSSYVVLKPGPAVNAGFFGYLFKSPAYIRALQATSDFIRDGQDLNFDNFCSVDLPVVPPEEQEAIGRFLDHYDRKIRRYIGSKQKLIKLLEEHKEAVIRRATTRGLDPSARLKPSGVEWLGEIPEHWEVWQVGHLGRIGNGSTPSRGKVAYWGGTFPWLNSSCVNDASVRRADQFVTDLALAECHLPIVPAGSVLVAITGQGRTRGMCALLEIEATINQHMAYVTPDSRRLSGQFLQLALTGAYRELRRISEAAGSTKGALTCWDVAHFRIPLPPRNEQDLVVNALRDATRHIEVALSRTAEQIALLREYRTRVFGDVVSGKVDVREAASRMSPDAADDLASCGESDAATDCEAEDNAGEFPTGDADLKADEA